MRQLIGVGVDDASTLGWETAEPPEQVLTDRTIRLRDRKGGSPPAWAASVVSRLEELDALPAVDPRGSRPLDFDDVADALRFLVRVMRPDTCPPWIGRLNTGGVQLSWHHGDVEVEAVFDRLRDELEVIVVVGDREWSEPPDKAETLFATVADRLALAYVEQPTTS